VFDDRRAFAPGITESKLDKAMHIRLPDGSYLTGFDAFRYISGRLPPLWVLYPLLWIPGIPTIGRRVYARIADSRKKCTHENCTI
jgi:predicted DCC family thiol-disulfide oxidoreductase YuxK